MDKLVSAFPVAENVKEAPIPKRNFHVEEEVYDYLVQILGQSTVSGMNSVHEKNAANISEKDTSISGHVNLNRINDIRQINKYLEGVNRKFENGQYLVVKLETKNNRKARILNKFPKFFSYIYYFFDFILKRVFPKWKPTRRLYFFVTKGKNQVLSLTEGLGRLICCGFEIVDFKQINNKTYIISRKTGQPVYDIQPTYGAIIRLKRIGKDGKFIEVFKFRTMHPYSEYLQDFIFEKNHLSNGGKFKDDFRMTTWGKFMRKYWIDELPMIQNWLKGEVKLVGVRPLSEHYFDLYPKDLQEMRIKVKPGLIPPFYFDLPETLEEIIQSEIKYLEQYFKHPVRTDIRYLFKSLYNIVIKGHRSK